MGSIPELTAPLWASHNLGALQDQGNTGEIRCNLAAHAQSSATREDFPP